MAGLKNQQQNKIITAQMQNDLKNFDTSKNGSSLKRKADSSSDSLFKKIATKVHAVAKSVIASASARRTFKTKAKTS